MTILEIAKHTHPGQGAFVRSVWMAMEQLAYQQRQEHHGRAFVAPQNYLAKIADASIPTIKRVCALLEEIGLLTVTRRKTSACRRDFNHYALKYPQAKVPTELWFHSSGRGQCRELDIKGGTNLSPAAAAASPLALRDKFVPEEKKKRLAEPPVMTDEDYQKLVQAVTAAKDSTGGQGRGG